MAHEDTSIQMPEVGSQMVGASFLERLPLARSRPLLAYGFAILASILATWTRGLLDGSLPPGFPYLTFFPAVILSAFLFGLGPGLLAGLLCGLAAWYWFIPPLGFALGFASAVALGFYVVIIGVDITLVHWMQRSNAHLAAERRRADSLAETRAMLFRELQHRVGNNLQMVASLLSLQSRNIADPEALAAIGDASRRVALVGRIQRTLYSGEGEQLALAPYIQTIVADTIAAAARDDIAFKFLASTGSATIEPGAAIPAALAVAEAVSNAIEHGFADHGGTIAVTVAQEGDRFVMTVQDDGAGLPDNFDFAASPSLGLRIARNLTSSLGGDFVLEANKTGRGAIARVRIGKGA